LKKKVAILIMVLTFTGYILVGCGAQYSGDTNKQQQGSAPTKEPTKEQVKLEVLKTAGASWKDSVGAVWVHSGAVYKNTGSVPVRIGESQMNFKAQDGGILGTSPMVYSVPDVVQPGETAFVGESTILDGISDPAQYKETSYNFDFDKATNSGNILEVSGVKGSKGGEFTQYKVTGVMKNSTQEKQDDIRLASALFDNEGTLLGVLTGSIDVGVNPGSEAGFELNYPELPEGVGDKVATVEVKAYGFKY
jgi:hypothetical protein